MTINKFEATVIRKFQSLINFMALRINENPIKAGSTLNEKVGQFEYKNNQLRVELSSVDKVTEGGYNIMIRLYTGKFLEENPAPFYHPILHSYAMYIINEENRLIQVDGSDFDPENISFDCESIAETWITELYSMPETKPR